MVTCTSCQGTNNDGDATTCIYCGQALNKRGWWRRFLGVFAGEKPAAGHVEAGTTPHGGQPSVMMSEQEEQSWEHLRTAENLRYEGRMEEAIAEYTTAISFNPNFAGVYTMRAAAYGETGQHDKALADLNKAVRLDPEFATAYDNRAPTYISLGMDAEAEQDVKRVARLGDDTSELRNLIEERKGQRSQSSP